MATTESKRRRVSARGSKRKGDQFERDLAEYFTSNIGIPVVRSKISTPFLPSPSVGMPDLINTPFLAVEAKRNEALDYRKAIAQAARNASSSNHPIVINRRSRENIEDSVCFMRLSDFMAIYRRALLAHGLMK